MLRDRKVYLSVILRLEQFHHIHHFFSGVPCYLLRSCHDSAPPGVMIYDDITAYQ